MLRDRGVDNLVPEERHVYLHLRTSRRDPYWDLDGRAVRTMRRQRRVIATTVITLSAVILGLILVHLPAVDAGKLVAGPNRPLLLTSLAGDVVACGLIFSREVRRRHAIRAYDEPFAQDGG